MPDSSSGWTQETQGRARVQKGSRSGRFPLRTCLLSRAPQVLLVVFRAAATVGAGAATAAASAAAAAAVALIF